MISVGGIQFARSSYKKPRTSRICFGDCSMHIASAMLVVNISQSGGVTVWFAVNGYCATLQDSRLRMALRKLPSLLSAIASANGSGSCSPSFFATKFSTPTTSSARGSGMRIPRHRLRSGSMIWLVVFAVRMSRQVRIYFSMVRRSACCAPRVSSSTSLRMITLKLFWPLLSSGADSAISLIMVMITMRSDVPASLGVTSMWYWELRVDTSMALSLTLYVLCSDLSFSTPGPK
mmetsp:Transcript_3544/g.6780  ORF Transcript_3544/g.6780 Transcript_3544/m.6780 type:complete len:233 (+) Transcript_3544:1299-1997(+)